MNAPAAGSVRAPRPGAPPKGDRGSGRTQRSVATWLTGAVSTVVVALAGFVATPLLVRWLGDAQWGAWTIVGEWLGYLGLTHLALGPGAITVFLLRAHNREEAGALTAMAKRGLRLYIWTALALIPLGLALAWWAPLALHADSALTTNLRWAVGLAAAGSLVLAPSQLVRSVLETVQRGYLVRAALLLQSLLITGLSLWWVWLRWGIVGMAAASVTGMAVGAGLWAWFARGWLPGWRQAAPAQLSGRELWRLNWPLVVAMAGNQVNVLTDNTVVGLMIGPAAVAGFALTQSLPLLAGARLTDIGSVSWAALGELKARSMEAFRERVIELAATVLGVGMVMMATVAVFNRPFVELWVGAAHYDGALLTWATAAGMALFGLLCFFSWLIDTQGDTRRRLWASSIGSGLNLGLSLWLVQRWGVAGVAAATAAAYACTDAWYLPYVAVRQYGVPGRALARALSGAAMRGGLWTVLIAAAVNRMPQAHTWMQLAVEAAGVGAAGAAYCWSIILRADDRAAWRARWTAWVARPA